MFNFGGMLSGIGDVGYMKVKKGIQAKHDKQMIETRAALQRKATIEAREYSRQQKKLTESKKIKDNLKSLKLFYNDNTATALSQSESLTAYGIKLAEDLQQAGIRDNTVYEPNDYIGIKGSQDFYKRRTPFDLSKFEEDPTIDLPFSVQRLKNLPIEPKTADEQHEAAKEKWRQAGANFQLEPTAANQKELEKATNIFEKLNAAKNAVKAKEMAMNFAPDPYSFEGYNDISKMFDDKIISTLNAIRGNKNDELHDYIVDGKLKTVNVNGMPVIQGDPLASELLYNRINRQVFDTLLPELIKDPTKANFIEPIIQRYSSYISKDPETFFNDEAFRNINGQQVMTPKFYNWINKKGPNAINKGFVVPTATGFNVIKFKNEDELNNYNQAFASLYTPSSPINTSVSPF